MRVSLGDDDGSYVSAWVTHGIEIVAGMLTPLPGTAEDIDPFMDRANAYSREKHGCEAMHLLDSTDDACEHLRGARADGGDPYKAVDDLFRQQAEAYWHKLGDVPVVEGDRIGKTFQTPAMTFKTGTPVTSIWHWFEHHYNLSVACDLMYRNADRQANQAG